MGVKMYPVLPGDTTKYPVHEIASSLNWQPQHHQNCKEPPPKQPCNKDFIQETINNTFVLQWQKITANASNIEANLELIDSGVTQSIIRTQNATNILHTIDDDTDSNNVSSSDEISMGSLPGLQERNMQDSDNDESTDGEMQFEFDLSEFSDDTMVSTPTGLYSESPSDDDTMNSRPPPFGLDNNVLPTALRSRTFSRTNYTSSLTLSSCSSSISMPGLAQRFQDDSSSDGSTSDTSFNLGPPPPLIQRNCDIFDSSDDNSSYSDDSATVSLSVSTWTSDSSICSSEPDYNLSYLTASDYESLQGINDDDDGDASFITAASSVYKLTGSIIFELPDDNTQPTERHICLSFITPDGTNENDASLQFYFENKD